MIPSSSENVIFNELCSWRINVLIKRKKYERTEEARGWERNERQRVIEDWWLQFEAVGSCRCCVVGCGWRECFPFIQCLLIYMLHQWISCLTYLTHSKETSSHHRCRRLRHLRHYSHHSPAAKLRTCNPQKSLNHSCSFSYLIYLNTRPTFDSLSSSTQESISSILLYI